MTVYLLENTLKIEINFDCKDSDYPDNICVSITEDCPRDEKVFRADQVNLFLTADEARKLAAALFSAAEESGDLQSPAG